MPTLAVSGLAKGRLAQGWPVEGLDLQTEARVKGKTLAAGKQGVSTVGSLLLTFPSLIPPPVPGFSAAFFQQTHRLNSHRPINRLAHVIDRQ